LAGCNAERIPRRETSGAPNTNPLTEDEKFAYEAKHFTEERLLGQEVKVKILLVDKSNVIYATVIHPNGRISASLLRQGLSMYDSWTASLCDSIEQRALLDAIKEAKEKRNGIWKTKDPNSFDITSENFINGIVTQIISAYTLVVKSKDDGKEETYTLSSIRAPKAENEKKMKKMKKMKVKEKKKKKINNQK